MTATQISTTGIKVRQPTVINEFFDDPETNCSDDANNQTPIKTESIAIPSASTVE